MSFLLGMYRAIGGRLLAKAAPLLSRERMNERGSGIEEAFSSLQPAAEGRAWFHAASVGELESLWSVISAWVREPGEAVVTVLSPSARKHVERLSEELKGMPCRILFAGYSPWEGRWLPALRKVRPSIFVTAKYEAWPELWASLAELRVPLVVVGARARRSLRVAKTVCGILGSELPRLTFLSESESDVNDLKTMFPEAEVQVTGEPRWDRVVARLKQGNVRAESLIGAASGFPRPWGILGQIWPQDLERWTSVTRDIRGSLWMVPHRVDAGSIESCERFLAREGMKWVRTSRLAGGEADSGETSANAILVDEMGFLAELYKAADWVYVGGGFGAGVHSTIEPAVQGVPIAIGPQGAGKFPEVAQLRASGQLSVVGDSGQLRAWLEAVQSEETGQRSLRWKQDTRERLGATTRVLETIRRVQSRIEG